MSKQHKTLNIRKLALLKNNPQRYYEQYPEEKPRVILSPKDNLTKSYSHKPYLAKMPYDRTTRNPYKMAARYIKLTEYEDKLKKELKQQEVEYDWMRDAGVEYLDMRGPVYFALDRAGYASLLEWDINKNYEKADSVQEIKEGMTGLIMDHLHMDYEGCIDDPAFKDIDVESEEFEKLYDELWVTPLDNAMKFSKNTDYCDDVHSRLIDNYIEKLEGLNALNGEDADRTDAINLLKIMQSNDYESPEDIINALRGEITRVNHQKNTAQVQATKIKQKYHSKNVALYEVANEKQNCSDVFDAFGADFMKDYKDYKNIEDFIDKSNFETKLNKDGTIKADELKQLIVENE